MSKEMVKAGEQKTKLVPAIEEKTIADSVLVKIKNLESNAMITFPPNYSPENAIRKAWFIIMQTKTSKASGERPVIEACTKESIAFALLRMVTKGMDADKKQGYFLAYGNQLVFQQSYFGDMLEVKRAIGERIIGDPIAQVVRKGEIFKYENKNGRRKIIEHTSSIETEDNDIIAAYAIINYYAEDMKTVIEHTEIMTIKQIEQAWKQSQNKPFESDIVNKLKENSTHFKFNDQMCKKTVMHRASKFFTNSSDDAYLFTGKDDDTIEKERLSSIAGLVVDAEIDAIESPSQPQAIAQAPESIPLPEEKQPVEEPKVNADGQAEIPGAKPSRRF